MSLASAQRELVARHTALVGLVAYEFTSDSDLVGDLVGVGNIALCGAAQSWRPGGAPFGSYARVVVRNAMINHLRKWGRIQRRERPAFCDGGTPEGEGDAGDIEGRLDLLAALSSIDGQLAQIVGYVALEGLTLAEVAARFGRPTTWAWCKYHEGIQALRAELLDREKPHAI